MPIPQELLDTLHELHLPAVWTENISSKERAGLLKVARQKLRQIKQSLRAEQDVIKRRWDGRNKAEAERERSELLPYNLIDMLVGRIEIKLTELNNAMTAQQSLPALDNFGTVIGGGEEYGGYVIGTPIEVDIYKIEYLLKTTRESRQLAATGRMQARQRAINAREQIEKLKPIVTKLEIQAKRTLWIRFLEIVGRLAVFAMLLGYAGFVPVGLWLFSSDRNRKNFDSNFMLGAVAVGLVAVTISLVVIGLAHIGGLRAWTLAYNLLQPEKRSLETAENEFSLMKNKYKVDTQAMTSLDAQIAAFEKRLMELRQKSP